jgi:hypothetical protein
MPRNAYRLTPALAQQITSFIRAGGYDWLAAQAAGIPPAVFQEWLRRGATRARPPYREFYEQVEQAKAQARITAEIETRKHHPLSWLRHGPGREAPQAPGWTTPVKPVVAKEHILNVLESPEWLNLLALIRKVLATYPDARVALLQALAEPRRLLERH